MAHKEVEIKLSLKELSEVQNEQMAALVQKEKNVLEMGHKDNQKETFHDQILIFFFYVIFLVTQILGPWKIFLFFYTLGQIYA